MRYTVPNDDKPRTIPVGRVGENDWTELAFDVREWLEEIPGAVVAVAYQRAGDANAYPLPATVEDGVAVVKLTAAETAKAGLGKIQLTITNAAGVVAKSRIYTAACLASLDGSGEPPEEWRPFIDEVFAAAVRAETAADNADNAAELMADRRFIGGVEITEAVTQFDGTITAGAHKGKTGLAFVMPMQLGRLYRVTFDGVVYYRPCYNVSTPANPADAGNNGRAIGNAYLCNYDLSTVPETSEPFCFLSAMDLFTAEAGEHAVKVEALTLEVARIPAELVYNSNSIPLYAYPYSTGNYMSVSLGLNKFVTRRGNFAVGDGNVIDGSWSFACNSINTIKNGAYYGFVHGAHNTVASNYARAGGFESEATGNCSIADGYRNHSNGSQSAAVGGRENVIDGHYAAAIGGIYNNITGNAAGIVAGRYAAAAEDASFIGAGKWNTTAAKGQAVVGYGNAATEDDVFEVGNGLDTDGNPSVETNDEPATRQNALAVKRDGTVVAQRAFRIGDHEIDEDKLARLLALIS